MAKNLWGDEEEEFRDIPEEAQLDENGNSMISPPANIQNPKRSVQAPVAEPVIDSSNIDLNVDLDEEEDYSTVLSDARIRLEMGKLYDMIMNHDLFQDVDADPNAAKTVQKQIRKFAKEQMEIMLGMRKDTTKVEKLEIDFPFNALEVEVLKKLAYTATKGASEKSDNYVPAVKKVTEEVEVTPKKKTLNAIGSTNKKPAPAKLQSKPAAPIERPKSKLPPEFEEHYKPLEKPVSEMTEEEIIARNKEAEARQKSRKAAKAPGALPQPTYEQQETLFAQRIASDAKTAGTVSTIMALMNNQKKK